MRFKPMVGNPMNLMRWWMGLAVVLAMDLCTELVQGIDRAIEYEQTDEMYSSKQLCEQRVPHVARAGPGAIWRDGGRYVKTKESRSLGQWL